MKPFILPEASWLRVNNKHGREDKWKAEHKSSSKSLREMIVDSSS
jgi:hypothetical protein